MPTSPEQKEQQLRQLEQKREPYLLGLDIGGTSVKWGALRIDGEILVHGERSVSFDRYRTPIIETVLQLTEQILTARLSLQDKEEQERLSGLGNAMGIAVSATGQIDVRTGRVAGTCGNLPGWKGTEIREALESRFHLPVTVANDANCMLLGEAWKGAAQGVEDVVAVTVGTGIGGAVMCGGRLLEGRSGLAAELGHMPLYASGRPCTCGQRGCAEQYLSITALHRLAEEAGVPFRDARILCEKMKSGKTPEPLRQIFEAWRQDMVYFLCGLVHAFNPGLLLIGGGISRQEELYIEPLRQGVLAGVMPCFREGLEIKAAECGNLAGLTGACRLWISERNGDFLPEFPATRK